MKSPRPSVLSISPVLLLLLGLASPASADPAYLCIRNADSQQVKVRINWADSDYEGPAVGFERAIRAGESLELPVGRNSAHSGHHGQVCLTFEPAGAGRNEQCFQIHGGNGILKSPLSERPNPYPGSFDTISPGQFSLDGCNTFRSYGVRYHLYTTAVSAVREATATIEPRWQSICTVSCDYTIETGMSKGLNTQKEASKEEQHAVKVSIEQKYKALGQEGKFNASYGYTNTAKSSLMEAASTNSTSNRTERIVWTQEKMKSLGVERIWVWGATATLSTGETYSITSGEKTCTPDQNYPAYEPGSKEHEGTCFGKHVSRDSEAIWDLLKAHGPMTPTMIGNHLGRHPMGVTETIRSMVESGYVMDQGNNVYALVPEGAVQ